MRLVVHPSFEPASLPRVLELWNSRVPLFDRLEVRRPEELAWGLSAAPGEEELRVFLLDAPGLAQALAAGFEALLQRAPRPALVALLPSIDSPAPSLPPGLRADRLDAPAIFAAAGVDAPLDPQAARLANLPYRDSALLALGTAIFRRAYARLGPEPKLLAVDCDGTLWQGLCSELGPEGVTVGPGELALHRYLLAQKKAGRLLALVSKNTPEDVEAVFARRSDLAIARGDFVAAKIGWQTKGQALRELARELGLGLDSFLLLDDSPAECAEASAALPEVAVLVRPAAEPVAMLEAAWLLDPRVDQNGGLGEARTRLYQEEAERRRALRDAPSFAEHVRSLEVRTEIRDAAPEEAGRIFELAQRTNQFNTSAKRPSAEEVAAKIAAGELLAISVRDRFGDYGLSGAMFLARDGAALRCERWLLSCRVLGRGVEADSFDALARHARDLGATELQLSCARLPRNTPAQRFVEQLGAQQGPRPGAAPAGARGASEGSIALRFSPGSIARAPRLFQAPGDEPAEGVPRLARGARAPDWNAVSALTRSPAALAEALGVEADHPAARVTPGDEGILEVIGEVMGRKVRPDDNLYALGADSLRLMRILARLSSQLGLELPPGEILYRADVARLLELAHRGRGAEADSGDDEAFLAAHLGALRDDPEEDEAEADPAR